MGSAGIGVGAMDAAPEQTAHVAAAHAKSRGRTVLPMTKGVFLKKGKSLVLTEDALSPSLALLELCVLVYSNLRQILAVF